MANPFTGFILPGAGAGGRNIIDSHLQNPMVQQASLGLPLVSEIARFNDSFNSLDLRLSKSFLDARVTF